MMNIRIMRPAFLIVILLVLSTVSCSKPGDSEEGPDRGFYLEAHQLLAPELHGFQKGTPHSREIFLLERGDSYIWLSELPGILVSEGSFEQLSEIWVLVQQRIYNPSYLKGTRITPAKLERVSHPTRPYIEQILVVERTQEVTDILSDVDKKLYAHELQRIPVGSKLLLVSYYTPVDDTVYSLTFLAPPEDFLFFRDDAEKIFFEMQFKVAGRPEGY